MGERKKDCTKCRASKTYENFSPHKLGIGGVRSICKPRSSKAVMATRIARPESREASHRASRNYRSSPNGSAKRVEWNRQDAQKNPVRYLLNRARARAKRGGIQFSITAKDVVVPKLCPVLGLVLVVRRKTFREPGIGGFDDSMSLDRVEPSLGYVPGNVRVISWRANRLKNASSIEELRAILRYVEEHQMDATRGITSPMTI